MNRSPRIVAVVDDEELMRTALVRLLSVHGYRVAAYARGSDLLTAAGILPIDCIVLDLHMPELSGFDLMAVMQSRGIHIPVVAITGNDDPGLNARVRALGAHALLLKPIEQDTLITAIEGSFLAVGEQSSSMSAT